MWKFDLYWIILKVPVLLLALSLHEYAHGKVADMLGDRTPRFMGRLTLDPRVHFDPIGFIALLVAPVGWAKPVPINPMNFKDYRKGTLMVALAGPVSNFILGGLSALILHGYVRSPAIWEVLGRSAEVVGHLLLLLVYINVGLAVFNLLPFPPLDGSRVLAGILPERTARKIDEFEASGMGSVILLFLIFTNILNQPLSLIITSIVRLMGL